MLDVGRLRVLLAISEHGGLPAAARALGSPAGDVAAQLSGLERELGFTLVEGDRLTPAGRRLAAHSGRVLVQLEAAESDAAAVANRAAGVLRVGVGGAAGRALLPDVLATLRATAPELQLRVEQLADERAGVLGADRLDVAVVGEYAAAVPRRTDGELDRLELLTEQLLVAVPARHRATGASVRLAELADERWVAGSTGGDALVGLERAAAGAGFEPVVVAHTGEDALALALVAAGHGVALVPASSVRAPLDGVRFLAAVDPGLRRTVTALVRRSEAADPGVQRLLDALGQAARRVAAAVPGVTAVSPAAPPIPEPYLAPAGPADTGARRAPYPGPADLPPRRPDPLSDPLPGAVAGPLAAGRGRPEPREEYRNGAGEPPAPRRDPWADRPAPSQGGAGRNGRAGALPPPGPPAERDPRARPAPEPPDRTPEIPPDLNVPYPTSPDLGVRSLSSAELPGRRPEPPRGTGGYAEPRSAGPPRRGRAELRDLPPDALPPAPPGSADDVRLSIFEDLQSEWFTRRDDGPGSPAWQTPADDGWRAAARLAEPTTAGTTTAGLPKRKPQALYVPGTANGDAAPNGTPTRSPQEVRGRLSSYREGVRRGRHAEPPRPEEH